jgi:hypothetical protein
MLSAYLDESGTEGISPMMCVAGFLFTKRNAEALSREWKLVLQRAGVRYFHAVDCCHRRGEFRGKSKEFANDVYRQLVEIIHKRACGGAVIYTLPEKKFDEIRQRLSWEYSQYTTCAHFCMQLLIRIAKRMNHGGVDFFIEAGHKNQAELARFVDKLRDQKLISGNCQFAYKNEIRALQTGDILAYEMAKFLRDLDTAPERPIRKSLEKLVVGSANRKVLELDEQALTRLIVGVFEGTVALNNRRGR